MTDLYDTILASNNQRVASAVNYIIDNTPALAWMCGEKRVLVFNALAKCDYALMTAGYAMGNNEDLADRATQKLNNDLLIYFANEIAERTPLEVDPTKIVFFSGNTQSEAESFVNQNPAYNVIHTTVPGALLEALVLFNPKLELDREERYGPWNTLSRRLAAEACGDVKTVLDLNKDAVKPTATFLNQEMPIFLENKNLVTIDGLPKEGFWRLLKIQGIEDEAALIAEKQAILTRFKAGKTKPT